MEVDSPCKTHEILIVYNYKYTLIYEIQIHMVNFYKFIIATGCQGCTIHYAGGLVVVNRGVLIWQFLVVPIPIVFLPKSTDTDH